MSDLEDLRRKRLEELQQQAAASESQQQMQQEMEIQKKQIMMQILTPEARSRLANLKLAKPELVNQVELQLIQLIQAGRIQGKINDEQLKDLLKRFSHQKREINITRK